MNCKSVTEFLAAFFPDKSERIFLRAFELKKRSVDDPSSKAQTLKVNRYSLLIDEEMQIWLKYLNESHNFYFIVNSGGERDEEIYSFNAWFIELDRSLVKDPYNKLNEAPNPPSITVETPESVQAYWLRKDECGKEDWQHIQQGLIRYFGGDEKFHHPSVAMPLPFFEYFQYDQNGDRQAVGRVKIEEFKTELKYAVTEMKSAFPMGSELGSMPEMAAIAPLRRIDKSSSLDSPSTSSVNSDQISLVSRAKGRVENQAMVSKNGNLRLKTPLITSYPDFMERQFTDGGTLAFHAGRGEVCLVQSITNQGKSTLIRNAGLSLSTGGGFPPVIENGVPRKTVMFNFEGAGSRFQGDLQTMTTSFTSEQRKLLHANLYVAHAPVVHDESLTFSRHMPEVQAQAMVIKPDVLIIDTASAAFEITNENDNAEIQSIMKGLIGFARRLNCLIVLVHHIGKTKAEEGKSREAAHRGRGASAWSDFAASIFNLEADSKNQDRVNLVCAKRKDGENYERSLILDRATRWFSLDGEIPQQAPPKYDLVVATVKDFKREVKRKEIEVALTGMSRTTVGRYLKEAIAKGDISLAGHGLYL